MVTAVAANTAWKKKCGSWAQTSVEGGVVVKASEKEVAASEPLAATRAKRKRVTRCEERKNADNCVGHVFRKDVDDVFRPSKACFDKRKSCLHEEHQNASDEDPEVVEDNLNIIGCEFLSEPDRRRKSNERCCSAEAGNNS